MQPKIAKEVTFLKLLQRRFRSVTDYKDAINDMRKEGLITELAYEEVMKPFSGRVKTVAEILEDTCAGRRLVKTKVSKMPKPPKESTPDPCGHGGGYRGNPC